MNLSVCYHLLKKQTNKLVFLQLWTLLMKIENDIVSNTYLLGLLNFLYSKSLT